MNPGSHILLNVATAPYRRSETLLAHSMRISLPNIQHIFSFTGLILKAQHQAFA
ncbi:hypothetical protein EAZG_05116 [Escherichia coli TA249]|nr:hypothetical protein EAZG_05116 [Escherichia coli TA249]